MLETKLYDNLFIFQRKQREVLEIKETQQKTLSAKVTNFTNQHPTTNTIVMM